MKHICGQCQKIFSAEGAYLRHTCRITGLTPVHNPITAVAPKTKLSEKALLSAVRQARRAHHSHGQV